MKKNEEKYMQFIERKTSLYTLFVGVRAIARAVYYPKINLAPKIYCVYNKDTAKIKISDADFKKAISYYSKLIINNDKQLSDWIDDYKKQTIQSSELINKYLKKSNLNASDIKNIFVFFENYFFISTALPSFVLSAMNNLLEKNPKLKKNVRYKKIIDQFSKPRAVERGIDYLLIEKIVDNTIKKIGCNFRLRKFLTPDEILLVANGVLVRKQDLEKKAYCIIRFEKNFKPVYSYQKKNIDFSQNQKVKVLTGNTVCKGRVIGRVRIVNSPEDMGNFKKGNILVSLNANPTLISCIKNASAIVSDEGGLMCHATILARELKIPGIVSTKIATKVLGNNDLVEVNATEGKVIILKRSK